MQVWFPILVSGLEVENVGIFDLSMLAAVKSGR